VTPKSRVTGRILRRLPLVHTPVDAYVRTLAAQQHGVFHLGQLDGIGLTRSTRERRVTSGAWLSLFEGIYRLGGVPPSWEGDVLAACWAGGPLTVASHRTAAALWGLPGKARHPIEITCRRWRRARTRDLVVHESNAFEPVDHGVVEGIPVASVARTLLDLGAVARPLTVDMAIDNALRRELVSLAELQKTLARLGRSGRNGAGVLRSVLEARGIRVPTDSEMESLLLDVLKRHGLPEPDVQFVVLSDRGEFLGQVDAAYADVKFAIEYESYEHHVGKAALVRDSARRNKLVAAAWTVVTATAVDLQSGGQDLCEAIRACLARHAEFRRR
jgi:hypothetical protein